MDVPHIEPGRPRALPRQDMLTSDRGPFWDFQLPAGWHTSSQAYADGGQVSLDPDGAPEMGRVVVTHLEGLGLRNLDEATTWCRKAGDDDEHSGVLLAIENRELVATTVGDRPGRLQIADLALPDGTAQVMEQWYTLDRAGGLLKVEAFQPDLLREPWGAHVLGEHLAATISWRHV